MLVRVTTDNHIQGHADLQQDVESKVESALRRFGTQVTRAEIHLADENSHKGGDSDKKCTVEARLAGLQPLAASANGGSLEQALDGALEKLVALLDHKLGRRSERKGRTAFGDAPAD